MNCREWHEAMALIVDGERAAEGLAEHLEHCNGCRQLLQDLRADQAELRKAPEIDPAVFAAVRVEGLRRAVRRKTWWRWRVAAASFATLLLVTGIWLLSPHAPREQSQLRPRPLDTPTRGRVRKAILAPERSISQPVRRTPNVKRDALHRKLDPETILSEWLPPKTRREPRGSPSEVAMRIQTGDPDVVILWLKEERFQ